MRASFAVEEAVRLLGENIRIARIKRRLPQALVAERAGISVNTLSKLENGDPGIAVGNVAAVLQALGFEDPLSSLADAGSDEAGLLLESKRLPQRVRSKRTPKGD